MAGAIELSILQRDCLNRHIATKELLISEISAWQTKRNAKQAKANGDYNTATRALYFAALTRLKDRELLANDDSMTNGEYKRQLRQRKKSQKSDRAYQTLANAHEAIYYDTNYNRTKNY